MNKILLIIPAYNEAHNIAQTVDNLIANYPQYDYIVINDGSTDNTKKICSINKYRFLDIPVNLGLSGAVRCGMKYANYHGYEFAVQFDGDGQHLPEYVEDMQKAMTATGSDIVIGSRYKTERKPFTVRMIGSQFITLAIYLTTKGKYIGDATSGMRLFNKKMIKYFSYNTQYTVEPDTLAFLINKGVRIEEVQVKMQDRKAGSSYLTVGGSIIYMLHMLFSILIFQWFRSYSESENEE